MCASRRAPVLDSHNKHKIPASGICGACLPLCKRDRSQGRDFRSGVTEDSVLLECYILSFYAFFQTFLKTLIFPLVHPGIKFPKKAQYPRRCVSSYVWYLPLNRIVFVWRLLGLLCMNNRNNRSLDGRVLTKNWHLLICYKCNYKQTYFYTRPLRKVASHFEYLENWSRGLT